MYFKRCLWSLTIVGVCLLNGCGDNAFIGFFQNHKKLIKSRISKYKGAIHSGSWNDLRSLMTPNLRWVTSDGELWGSTKKRRYGQELFIKSLQDIPQRRDFDVDIESIQKIDDDHYMARVNCRLRISTGTDAFDTIIWAQMHHWRFFNGDWMLSEIKDLEQKTGHKGRIIATNPPLRKKPR